MRRTLTAIIVTALVGGALLLVATQALDTWYWRLYAEAQALHSSTPDSDAATAVIPYELERSPSRYAHMFVLLCAVANFWVVFFAIPCLLLSRRLFSGAVASSAVAAVVTCIISGLAFALLMGVRPYISPLVPFGAGGTIGIVGILLLANLLPPNTSLERP